MIAKSFLFASLLALAGVAHAASTPSVQIAPDKFADSRQSIEKALRDTERFSELTRSQREDLKAALDRMERLLSGVSSVDQLSEKDKVTLFNDQELINNTLSNAAEDSRLVCKREKKVGSNRAITQCMTVAERRRARDRVERDWIQIGQPLPSE